VDFPTTANPPGITGAERLDAGMRKQVGLNAISSITPIIREICLTD
jgi:hypothetical protein